jgi:hypothetical protein
MDVRMAVLQQAVAGAKFHEGNMVARVIQEAHCTRDQVWETLWGLVAEGLIYLDPDRQGSGTDNWRWRASDLGRQVAGGGNWEPRNPEGYLRRLRSFRPPIDEGALLYVEEALRAFRARCYLATSVMLGVAVESVFNGLAEAFVTAIPEKTTSLRKALNNPRASQNTRFEELRKALEPIRPQLPDGLSDRVTLDAVADLLRTARNDAGHPTGKSIDEGTAHAHLYMGAELLLKMTALTAHFESMAGAST